MEGKKRRPLIAAIFSLIDPGLGFVYNGKLTQGVIITAVLWALTVLLFLVGALKSFTTAAASFAIDAIARIFFIIQAASRARRLQEFHPAAFNRWFVYAPYILLILVASAAVTPLFGIRSFGVPTASMEPAIEAGDRIVVDVDYYRSHEPAAGDVIAFRNPNDPQEIYLKRCIAVGGQTVEIRDGLAYVDSSRSLPSLFIKRMTQEVRPRDFHDPRITPPGAGNEDQYGPVTVPAGEFFALGDFRDNSLDSRFFGFVDRTAIVGKAAYVYWSDDPGRIGASVK